MTAETVDFYCDPGCAWTWLTSLWLEDVAAQRSLQLRWHPFSLTLLNEGKPVAPKHDTAENRANLAVADRATRVLAVLSHDDDHARAGRFFAEFGRRFHGHPDDHDPELVAAAAAAAGVVDAVDRATAPEVYGLLDSSLQQALALAGPGIGSPVLRIGTADRGFHGPIQSPPLTGPAALRVFDALVTLQDEGAFYEIKRGRSSRPSGGRNVAH